MPGHRKKSFSRSFLSSVWPLSCFSAAVPETVNRNHNRRWNLTQFGLWSVVIFVQLMARTQTGWDFSVFYLLPEDSQQLPVSTFQTPGKRFHPSPRSPAHLLMQSWNFPFAQNELYIVKRLVKQERGLCNNRRVFKGSDLKKCTQMSLASRGQLSFPWHQPLVIFSMHQVKQWKLHHIWWSL